MNSLSKIIDQSFLFAIVTGSRFSNWIYQGDFKLFAAAAAAAATTTTTTAAETRTTRKT